MAWQRSGDTGATYPALMATRGDAGADERTVNEVAGFIWRLSMLSGAHLTDYVIDAGTVEMIGGPRTEALLRHATKHKLLTRVRTEHGTGFKLVEDPDFIHLRARAEVEWERQQRADTRDVALIVPVRRRDGDNCRWCGIGVVWRGTKTKRSGEYDHLRPGEPGTVETMIVVCRGCNAARGGNVAEWDSAHNLRPAPTTPRYGRWTAELLTENGYPTLPTDDSARPAPAPGADPAPDGVRPATGPGDETAAQAPGATGKSTSKSLPRSDETTSSGSGRDGSGMVLPGGVGHGPGGAGTGDPPSSVPRRRGRRGGRRRGGDA
jgi:hypothetical protein